MSKPVTQSELTQVLGEIRDGFKTVSDRFNKLEVGQAEIKGEMKAIDEKLSGQIQAVDERLTGQIQAIDGRLTGKIEALDVKLSGQIQAVDVKLSGKIDTLDEKVSGLDTRLKNVETSVQKIPELAEKVGEFK